MSNPASVISVGTALRLPIAGGVVPSHCVKVHKEPDGPWQYDKTYADLLALCTAGELQGLLWVRDDGSVSVFPLAYVGEKEGRGVFVFAGGLEGEEYQLHIFTMDELGGTHHEARDVTAPDVEHEIEELRQGLQAEAATRAGADASLGQRLGAAESAIITERAERTYADAGLQSMISAHTGNKDNPHEVTAHQVGTYTQSEIDDAINDAISGEVGGWLGNLTVADVNALTEHKKGDSATMLDSGTVMPGNVEVEIGDDIMWVDSLQVWQPKISDHLHHDNTLVGTGSTSEPLGVDTSVIATRAFVEGKGLEEDNGVLYFR